MKTLTNYIEEYLANEGLVSQIPVFRKRSVFQSPSILIVLIWFGGLWVSLIGLHYLYLGTNELWRSVIIPIAVFSILFIGLAFYFVLRQKFRGREINKDELANSLGNTFLFTFPILLSISAGVITNSWQASIIHIVFSVLLLFFVLFINSTYLLKLSFHLMRASLTILSKSIATLIAVFPLLLAVIFLSIFSRDFWLVLIPLGWPSILAILLLLFIPAFLLSYAKTRGVVGEIIGQFPDLDKLGKAFQTIDFFGKLFDGDRISERSWEKILLDLKWRDFRKLKIIYGEEVIKATVIRTAIYVELTNVLLLALFFVYFMIAFMILFPGEELFAWLQMPQLFPGSVLEAYSKVAMVLSAVMAVTARVSTFTDSDYKTQILGWIGDRAKAWFSALVVYDVAISPNYQFWKYKVNDGKRFNANIVVKPELSKEQVEQACRSMASRAPDSAYLVIVTAFEKEEETKDYDLGHMGKRWQLLINRSNGKDGLTDMTLDLGGDLRFANEVGLEAIQKGETIPDEWFGNTSKSQDLAKKVWELDADKELFEHPYVFEAGEIFNLELSISRRLSSSSEYRELVKPLFNLLCGNLDKYKGITISLNLRGTADYLVDLYYIPEIESLSYRDAFMKSSRYDKLSNWLS